MVKLQLDESASTSLDRKKKSNNSLVWPIRVPKKERTALLLSTRRSVFNSQIALFSEVPLSVTLPTGAQFRLT